MLQRVFDERDAALRPAFAPLVAWDPVKRSLESVLDEAVEGYLGFLRDHPNFVALVEREGIEGGARLRATPHASSAMEDAFHALHGRTERDFDVNEVVIAFVSLCFFPVAHRKTFLPGVDRDPKTVVDVLLHLVGG